MRLSPLCWGGGFVLTLQSCKKKKPSGPTSPTEVSAKNVNFKNVAFLYDGKEHAIEISESLPSGLKVTYTNNRGKDQNIYEATATFSLVNSNCYWAADEEVNDKQEVVKKAVMTIYGYSNPADFMFSNGTITGYQGKGGIVAIPATINGISVTTIGESAFSNDQKYDTNIISVIIPNSVTTIKRGAFSARGGDKYKSGSKLRSIIIPNSITIIPNGAFSQCDSLRDITLPNSITSIEESAFFVCQYLQNINIPISVRNIGELAFESCTSLQTITLPEGITNLADQVFYMCYSLKNVTLPSSITSIGKFAFSYCVSLENLTIPNGVRSIGWRAFEECNKLKNITLPQGITNIELRTFYNCTSLESMTVPSSVNSIGEQAFIGCKALSSISLLPSTPPALAGTGAFSNTMTIRVPAGSVNAYKTAANWNAYQDKIVAQ